MVAETKPGNPMQTTKSSLVAVTLWIFSVAALVFIMIIVGGATRLTDSGLSITEWKPLLGAIPPLSQADWAEAFEKYKQIPEYSQVNEGMSLAAFKFIFWWEWGHRFLGRFIGLAFAVPLAVFWFMGVIPQGYKVRLLAILALGGLQGFVGWYMVQSGLVDRIDVSQYRLALHLSIAFVILSALVWTGLDFVRGVAARQTWRSGSAVFVWLGALLAILVFSQVALGAFVAGTKAGLTYNTWPLMDGVFVPSGLWSLSPWYLNISENITAIQFNHRTMAYVLVSLALAHAVLMWFSQGASRLQTRTSLFLFASILVQAVIGIATLVAAKGSIPIGLGLAHQGWAAVVMTLAVWHFHALVYVENEQGR